MMTKHKFRKHNLSMVYGFYGANVSGHVRTTHRMFYDARVGRLMTPYKMHRV